MKIREFCDMNMFEQILQQWCEATGMSAVALDSDRSEERRVGKECRSRWSPYH